MPLSVPTDSQAPKGRGRPRIYHTEEEKVEARKKSQLKRYYAKREEILAKQAAKRKAMKDEYARLKWEQEERARVTSPHSSLRESIDLPTELHL